MLVLNTVINGEKLDSIGDIGQILASVDTLLAKNPLNLGISSEKKEPVSMKENIRKADQCLAGYDRQIRETNASYQENTNDAFMAMDAFVGLFRGESGKKIYEDHIRSLKKNFEKDYGDFMDSLK